jgi:hypothetical protein
MDIEEPVAVVQPQVSESPVIQPELDPETSLSFVELATKKFPVVVELLLNGPRN